MDILAAYNIADTEYSGASGLTRIAEVCVSYGQRIQSSIFECRLSPTRFAKMITEVENEIYDQVDSVLIGFPVIWMTQRRDSAFHKLGDPWVP